MKESGIKYGLVNLAVMATTAYVFVTSYGDIKSVFYRKDIPYIAVVLSAAGVVHLIKAGRLYLVLYGTGIDASVYIREYCKVTPVSMAVPFKAGEFFRLFCYGWQLGNPLKGAIIVLLDRFMDTAALVTMIFLVWIFNGGKITLFTYLLVVFLIFVLLIYYIFPGVQSFWRKYILRARATEKRLSILKMLNRLQLLYRETRSVSKGRGVILYVMSALAWSIELGSLVVLNGISGEGELSQTISGYLSSAMGAGVSVELRQFIFLSVILMILVYLVMEGMELLQRRKRKGWE